MSFINPALLAALGFTAIPVILHFMLRAKPKRYLFPALRLIQQRRRQNVQRLRLRHLFLLLLRILLIALFVFALARPSLPAASYSLSFTEWITLIILVGVAIAAYMGLMALWRRRRLPHHQLIYRRAWLRVWTGVVFFLLLLLLVAWPYQRRVFAEIESPGTAISEEVPVAAVMVFDTSLSMSYLRSGKTALEEARELAAAHLETLPTGSRIAITETSGSEEIVFQSRLDAAIQRLKRAEGVVTSPISSSLNNRIRAAIRLLEKDREETLEELGVVDEGEDVADAYNRELYLLTDFQATAWTLAGAESLRRELERVPWLSVYLIDVGREGIVNTGITGIDLSTQYATAGRPVYLNANITTTSENAKDVRVELYLNDGLGSQVKRGDETITASSGQPASVFFSFVPEAEQSVQGELRLVSTDPYRADDARYFSIQVQPPMPVLFITDDSRSVFELSQALAPAEFVAANRAAFLPKTVQPSAADELDFAQYPVICLVNVGEPKDELWERLAQHVRGGGGLVTILGKVDLELDAYRSGVAAELLPGLPTIHDRGGAQTRLEFADESVRLIEKLSQLQAINLLGTLPVRRFWQTELQPGATVSANYNDDDRSVAIAERAVGAGRVVMLTTGVDLQGSTNGRNWSDLPRAGWAFIAFADLLMKHTAGFLERDINYESGELARLVLPATSQAGDTLLRMPDLRQTRIELPYSAPYLEIFEPGMSVSTTAAQRKGLEKTGHYQVLRQIGNDREVYGFSVNPPDEESDFQNIGASDLDLLLGEDRYEIAKSIDDLSRQVRQGRLGTEVYSLILVLAILFFCGEHIVANQFYSQDHTASSEKGAGNNV